MYTLRHTTTSEGKREVLDFLQNADFAINDIQVQREQFQPDYVEELFSDQFRQQLINELTGSERLDAKIIHTGSNGENVSLTLEDESDGTQKFFAFAGPWLEALKNGQVLVVDELNDNLHPLLVKHLVQMFHDETLNKNNAQLIFTTHETSILSQEVFRRDQIWFTEKDEYNATTLYPLSDFKPRKDVENLEKGYLQGRYGSLPYFRTVKQLMDTPNG